MDPSSNAVILREDLRRSRRIHDPAKNLRPPREGGRLGRWVRAWNPCVSPPLIRPDGHLLPWGEGFSPLCQALDSATPGRDALCAE
ncbi:MAG: hypothetical protein ACO3OZ_14860 [bacterium]